MKKLLGCLLLVALLSPVIALNAGKIVRERGFYLGENVMNLAKDRAALEQLADRLAKSGYTHVYFSSWTFGRGWILGKVHDNNLRGMVKIFRDRGLKMVVTVASIGDPTSFMNLLHDEVEALPAIDEPYRVVKGQLVPENIIRNSSFEAGWQNWRPDANSPIKIDDKVSASGKNSLHFQVRKPQDCKLGMIRAWTVIKCKPFQQYKLSFKLKTRNLQSKAWNFGINVTPLGHAPDQPDGFRYLCFRPLYPNQVKATQEWTTYTKIFNSLEYSEIKLAIGAWHAGNGDFWIDDVELKPASFLNVVPRADTPVVLKSQDGKTIYQAGRDYYPVRDPLFGHCRWEGDFNDHHVAPTVKLTSNSRIPENSIVLANYHHAAFALTNVCICLNSPKLKPTIARQIDYLHKVVKPDGYLIWIDEHRTYGYDPACLKAKRSAAAALRDIAIFTRNKIREVAPKAPIYMWDDMFNPYANCRPGQYYYLIKGKGALDNSWVGLPKDITILQWTANTPEKLAKATKFWSDNGFKYVCFPGYFDAKTYPARTSGLLDYLVKQPNCIGLGFAQWTSLKHNHHVERFAQDIERAEKALR